MDKVRKILGVTIVMALLVSSATFLFNSWPATADEGEGGMATKAEPMEEVVPEEDTSGVVSTGPVHMVLEDLVVISRAEPVEETTPSPLGWQTIMTDGFEEAFPGVWSIYVGGVDAYWGKDSYRSNSGSYSAFCAKSGSAGVDPPSDYLNNMDAWMVYGPFSLVGATDAELNFYMWALTQINFDYFKYLASINGTSFYGWQMSGVWNSWTYRSFDLTNVGSLGNLCGQPQVWIAFQFKSNSSFTYDGGAFIDDVVLRKYVPSAQFDLEAVEAYLSTQAGDTDKNYLVGTPTVGQDVYFHFKWNCIGSGTTPSFRTELKLDGTMVCYGEGTAEGGYIYTAWCINPWTATAGSHTLTGVLDVYDDVSESNEANNETSDIWNTGGEASWTFMVYLDGDNNLEGSEIASFNLMEYSANNPDVNVIVQFDRIPGYDSSNGDWTTTRRYEVKHDTDLDNFASYTLDVDYWELGELNMADPDTLIDFVSWAKTNYPADHYCLVPSNHGGGWKPRSGGQPVPKGIIWDDTSGDYMSTAELSSALSSATSGGTEKLDVLFLDACLMQMIEVGYQVKNYSQYLVASEHIGWGPGPYHDYISYFTSTTTAEELAIAIVNYYHSWFSGTYCAHTMSATDLSQYGLASEVDDFALALTAGLSTYRTQIESSRATCQEFYDPSFIDLYHFAFLINENIVDATIQSAAQAVMTGVNNAVIAEAHENGSDEWYHELGDSHGISIYFPSSTDDPGYSNYNSSNLEFVADKGWDEFLAAFFTVGGGSISGHVYQSNGTTPIEGAWVGVFDFDTMHCFGWISSNIDGSYTFGGLPTGQYAVRVEAESYALEWYDGVLDRRYATPVPVTAPDDTPGIDFTLEPGGSILGHVYQSNGTTPIEGAQIDVFDYDSLSGWWVGYETAWTSADGSYKTGGLPTGNYGVRVIAQGYATEWYQDTYNVHEATPVSVTAPDDTTGKDFSLEPGGTISGNVIDTDTGDPVSGVQIIVFDYDSLSGMWASYGWAQTNENGYYVTTGLPAGDYAVQARPTGNYIWELYQNAYYPSDADSVTVTVPDNTPGIDFSLEEGGTISGNVYQSDGTTPIEGAWVNAFDYGSGATWGSHLSGTITAPDGSYTIPGLPEGDYCVWARASGYGSECYEGSLIVPGFHSLPVTVTELGNTPGINFRLDTAGTISGTVYDDGTLDPLPDIPISVCTYFSGTVSWSDCVTDAEGNYEITAPYGEERYVRAGEWQVPTGGYGVQFQGPVVVSEIPNTGIDFYLEPAGGPISGTVYEDGLPLSDVIIAVTTSTDYGCSNSLVYGIAISDSNGEYEVTAGLPPGDYYVSAGKPGYVTQYYSDSLTWQDATLVSDGSSGIDFSLVSAAGTVKGHVYEADGVTPIRNARVDVFTLDDKHITSCYASSRSGRYAVQWEKARPVLPEGDFKACASASGYPEQWRDFTIYQGEDTILDFHLGAGEWSVPMTATTDTEGNNLNLEFGTNISATDGYDSGIDVGHPPLGPGVTLDAYFSIVHPTFPQLDKDYRAPADSIQWTLHAESDSEDITLTWDTSGIPPELSAYMDTGISVINMKTQDNVVLPVGVYTITISVSTEVEIQISLKAGWNMVSVPVTLQDTSAASVFAGTEVVYTWNPATKSYYPPTDVEPEKSYWVAVLSDMDISVSGVPVYNWTSDITAGWNMSGSVFDTVSFADPQDNPDGSVEAFAFWWNPVSKSYDFVTTIESKKGHWIAATQNCTLTLSVP